MENDIMEMTELVKITYVEETENVITFNRMTNSQIVRMLHDVELEERDMFDAGHEITLANGDRAKLILEK